MRAPLSYATAGYLLLCVKHLNININVYLSSGFGDFKCSTKSFLFSLRNKDNLKPFNCPFIMKIATQSCVILRSKQPSMMVMICSYANRNQDSRTDLGKTYSPPPGYEPCTPRTRALLAESNYYGFQRTVARLQIFLCVSALKCA